MGSEILKGNDFLKLLHFGFAVHDIDKTMAAYRDLFGIRWEPVVEHATSVTAGGERHAGRVKVTHGYTSDGAEIEMVQAIEGRTPDEAVLGAREGVSHLALRVDDLAAEKERLVGLGVKIISEGRAPRADWLFVSDDRLGGALVQLVQMN